jgi:hypothetical protein
MPYSHANKVDIWYEVAGDGLGAGYARRGNHGRQSVRSTLLPQPGQCVAATVPNRSQIQCRHIEN